jgi:hypothetical protein
MLATQFPLFGVLRSFITRVVTKRRIYAGSKTCARLVKQDGAGELLPRAWLVPIAIVRMVSLVAPAHWPQIGTPHLASSFLTRAGFFKPARG